MNNSPFFSVLVPTYNQSQYLSEALDSLINQTDNDWEAIIVNDGSTDNTANILDIYARNDTRFHVIHKENGGTGSALNLALKHSKGEWVCWLSSDDVFEIDKLSIHRKWISKNPDYKFFFSNLRQLVGTSGKIINLNPSFEKNIPLVEFQIIETLRRNYIFGNSICIHREAWLNTGYFNEKLKYAQDYDMWLRLMIKHQALFIPEFTYLQRIYPEQESQKFSDFCLYDSAKSSIQILNNYNIEDLVPLVNLQNTNSFKKLVNIIFDIVFDPSAFIYQIGFHPLLILKTKQFVNKFSGENNDINRVLKKRLDNAAQKFKNTPQGFWCKSFKNLEDNIALILEEPLTLSFEKLGENHYWWLKHIESDLQDSVLNYLQRFCNYNIALHSERNGFKINFQHLINLQTVENQDIYIKYLSLIQEDFPVYSFADKMLDLERLDTSLSYIAQKIIKKYGVLNGFILIVWIYFLRFFRLLKQGNLLSRFQGYIKYVTHLYKF